MKYCFSRIAYVAVVVVGFAIFFEPVFAQTQPTPEQMRQIQQLPPPLREQALEVIRQAQQPGQAQTGMKATAKNPASVVPATKLPLENGEQHELRVEPNSRLIIDMSPYTLLSDDELQAIRDNVALSRVSGSHYYQLDEEGVLLLPGLQSVPLLGLTVDTIVKRLGAISSLESFEITATILDEEPIGPEALEPFGYGIFENDAQNRDKSVRESGGEERGFEPSIEGPVPPDYVLGPGDAVRVQLYGNEDSVYEYVVSRSGELNLPRLGPIIASGIRFSEFRENLKRRVKDTLIGTQASISMGQLRSIRVFILGDSNRPGSYVVSSLATISSALYKSGGISRIGSLRKIELKRQGKLLVRFDLYDLLLNGDTSKDKRLQSGDVIFVPPVGQTIGVSGAVRRPAIYEIRGRASVTDIVALAGGLLPDADPPAATLARIQTGGVRRVLAVNLIQSEDTRVQAGDLLTIPTILPDLAGTVTLVGHVQRPGTHELLNGMRISDLIPSPMRLKRGADTNYIMIRRESELDRSVQILSANLRSALRSPGSDADIFLQARDTIHVFDLNFGRQRVIGPILEELKLQSRYGNPYSEVNIAGFVRAPGPYPLEPGMRVSDLIRAGGDMEEGAYSIAAELTRYEIVDGHYRSKKVIHVDLNSVLRGDATADLELVAHDHLSISLVPDWDSEWTVTIEGEVRFPGEYQVLRGETLSQLLERAGGPTARAFPAGAIFLRESLKDREKEQIKMLARRMESDLAALSLQSLETSGAEALSIGKSLLAQVRSTEPVGRLVIDVARLMTKGDSDNGHIEIELKDGDRLLIPTKSQEVTVIGEAQSNTSHLYHPGLTRDDYISLSGGLTRKADKKLIYIVRASGEVVSAGGSRWFGRGKNTEIAPGDTIVVPLDTDRIRPLTFWTNVTQILYQGAIAVAAVQTFRN